MNSYFFREYKQLILLAVPLIFIQLCQASLGLIDTFLAGQYNFVDLAAVGLGSVIWTSIYIFLVGILYVLVPKFANQEVLFEKQRLYAIAKRLVLLLSILGFFIVNVVAVLVPYFIDNPGLGDMTRKYMQIISFAFPALVPLSMLRFVCEGHQRLKTVIILSAVLLLLNFCISYVFVYGWHKIPSQGGVVGCAIGTVLSAYISLLLMFFLTKRELPAIFDQKENQFNVVLGNAVELLKEGLPIGISLILQISALALVALTVEGLGVKYVATHQIIMNIAMCAVMIPLAIGNALTIQISSILGESRRHAIQNVVVAAVLSLIVYSLLIVILFLAKYTDLVAIFTSDTQVINIANEVMVYFIIFLILDSCQMVMAGILRGFQEFVKPLIAILIAYWVISLPVLFLLKNGWIYELRALSTIWLVITSGLCVSIIFLLFVTISLVNNKILLSRENKNFFLGEK